MSMMKSVKGLASCPAITHSHTHTHTHSLSLSLDSCLYMLGQFAKTPVWPKDPTRSYGYCNYSASPAFPHYENRFIHTSRAAAAGAGLRAMYERGLSRKSFCVNSTLIKLTTLIANRIARLDQCDHRELANRISKLYSVYCTCVCTGK